MYEAWFSTTAEDIPFGAQIGCRHLPVYVGEPNGAASAIDGRLSRFGCRLRGTFLVKCSVIEFGDSGNSSRQGRVIGSMMELYRPSIDNACLHKNTNARTLLLEVLSPIVSGDGQKPDMERNEIGYLFHANR
jgi:hypothetical protein